MNFSIEKKGYNIDEVDRYVEDLEAKVTRLQSQNSELEQKLATAKRLIRRFSDTENALKQNIADSKRAAAYMISDAHERSEELLDNARESCGEIISDLDIQIAERMGTIDRMKAEVTAFKDELFKLYSSHIELIDTIADTAESFEYVPDYSDVAEAVDKFEEGGNVQLETPKFVEYPEESIFAEMVETENQNDGNFIIDSVVDESKDEVLSFEKEEIETAVDDKDQLVLDAAAEIFDENSEEEMSFDLTVEEEADGDESASFDDVIPVDETDYFKFLEEFANSDEDAAE